MRRIRSRRRLQRVTSYRRVLVPVADDVQGTVAVDVACRLAAERRVSVGLMAVLEIPPALPLDVHLAAREEEARRLLERAAATAESFGVRTTRRVVRGRDAGAAILDEARASGSELIVLATARTTLRSTGALVFGDAVRHVLAAAPCRVLVVAAGPGGAPATGIGARGPIPARPVAGTAA